MGWQIIKQVEKAGGEKHVFVVDETEVGAVPGLYALWSNNTDTLFAANLERGDVVDLFVKIAAEDARYRAEKMLELVDTGRRAYHQFTLTFDEAVQSHNETKARDG